MGKLENHIKRSQEQLSKALDHLEYSYQKIQKLSTLQEELNEETLETWESFCARFSRVADIFLMRFVKAVVRYHDPSFEGSLRDFINSAEKLRIVESTEDWIKIRELRNIASHEYTDKDFSEFLNKLKKECPKLLAIRRILEQSEFLP